MSEQELKNRDGVVIAVGQIWRDCDQRMSSGNRRCRVVAIDVEKAKVQMQNVRSELYGSTWVSAKRMHKSSTGWELVP